MSWQRKILSTGASVGDPGPLPEHLVGLEAETLADLPAALSPDTLAQLELEDTGFVWVDDPPPAPPPVRTLARIDFMRRFTTPEQIAIQSSANPVVKNFLFMLGIVSQVELDDADTVAGVGYLEQQTLIAAGRAAQILG